MKVLFITSNRLGDAVLSTGLLDYINRQYRGVKITVACGALPASLFEGMPNLKELIVLEKQKFHGHWLSLWQEVGGISWDIVIDLRDSIVSRVVFAKNRYIFSKQIDKNLHKVEQAAAVMRLVDVPSPRIWVSPVQERTARTFVPDGSPVLAIGPTANWIGKTWPAERFIKLIAALTDRNGILPNARVAVFAAPGEEEAAYEVLEAVTPVQRQIDVIAKTDPGTAAAILQLCDLYVGNDSGLMHCAAAAGIPTVGLFGPSYPHIYRPWGDHTTYVRTPETFGELTNFKGYDPKTFDRSLMTSLKTENVVKVIDEFWKLRQKAA